MGGPGECPDENVLLEVVPACGRVPGRVLAEQVVVRVTIWNLNVGHPQRTLQAGQRSIIRE